MPDYWITSDTHFGHDKLIAECGRPPNHTFLAGEGLLIVPPEDTLIHLGDVAIGNEQAWHQEYIAPLRCKKVLVMGNHDKRTMSWYLSNGWDFVCHALELQAFGKHVRLTHRPERVPPEILNVHGHLHNTLYRVPDTGIPENCILYAPELENYAPVRLAVLLGRYAKTSSG